MAEFDPDAFLSSFDPDAFLRAPGAPKKSMVERAIEPITSYPATEAQMAREAFEQIGHGAGQIASPASAMDVAKGVGNVGLGTLGYVTAPIGAAYRTLLGQPIENVTGIPKEYTEFAAGLATPGVGLPRLPARPLPRAPVPPQNPLGVTLSQGQSAADLALLQREQAALRGQLGQPARDVAEAFRDQQTGQLAAARENVARGFDPFGMHMAESPYEAGQVASQGMRQAAQIAKADVGAAYKRAEDFGGEIHAGAIEGIAQKIKGDLSLRDEPVFIDSKTTPYADAALADVEQTIDRMRIPNRASPFGEPNRENIVGVSLQGLNQIRKRLSSFRRDAWRNNEQDGRAASAVVDAFDRRIDAAFDAGLFEGDPRAVQAWKDARAAHADYKATFGKQQPNDPVGRVVEKVIGARGADVATPNAVADFMYGSVGVNPSDLNVATARRFRNVFGPTSPEWSAVKQGLWSRIVDPGADLAQWGAKKTADRINRFIKSDGRDMAETVFAPSELKVMQDYADVLRKLEVPQAAANWSNTGTARVFQKIGNTLTTMMGVAAGSMAGHAMHLPFPLGEIVGAGVAKGAEHLAARREASIVARQMPLLGSQLQQYARAVAKANQQPTPLMQRALRGAAVNLDGTLRKFGSSLSELQSPAVVGAEPDQNQQNIEGPPRQQNNGGKVENRNGFAKGGGVWHDTKLSHDTVHYVVKSKRDERCSNCSMFVPKAKGGPACTLVKNPIFPTGWCNRYDPQAKRANGGRVDPKNIHTEPSEAQKAAGNYAKDHVRLHGLDITVENAKGSTRRGTDPNGKPWSVKMPAHYGYIKGTVGKDKDHVDVYLGPHKASTTVYVVDQNNAESGRFDEHKAFIGFGSKAQVLRTYRAAFSDGKADQRIGHVREMSIDDFKGWLDSGDTTKRIEHHELKHRAAGGGVQGDDNNDLPVMLEPPRNPARMTPAVENVVGGLAQGAVEPLTDAGYMLGDYLRTQEAPPASDVMAAGTGLGMALIGPKAKGIRAFHGSPYDFNRFDISRVGTGEGTAYGEGLYFAENEPVALSYKNSPRVTDMDWPVAGTDYKVPAWVARSARTPQGLMEVRQDFVNRLAESRRALEEGNWNAATWVSNQQRIIDALDAVKAGAELKQPGHMYEVNINAHPEQFLNWDQPLSKQPHIVQAAPEIMEAAKQEAYHRALAATHQDRADQLWSMVKNPHEIPGGFAVENDTPGMSAALTKAGIPGIKYLDQGSRYLGRGTSNYVVFDDKLIDILGKYGLAGLSPIAAAELMQQQQRAAGGGVRGYQDAGVVPTEDAMTPDPWQDVPRTSYGTPAITVRPEGTPVVSDADLAQQAREAAALRMRQAAASGARQEGMITGMLEGMGEEAYGSTI